MKIISFTKYLFLGLKLGFLPFFLHAQLQLLSSHSQTIKVEIHLAEEKLSLIQQDRAANDNKIQSFNARCKGSEILIDYQLQAAEKECYYQVALQFSMDGQPYDLSPDQVTGDIGDKITTGKGRNKQIILTHPSEKFGDLSGLLTITITADYWGIPVLPFGVNCDDPPQFTGNQKLPYYLAGGAGLVTIGLGQIFGQMSQSNYEQYISRGSFDIAHPLYQKAGSQHKTDVILSYTGIGLVATSMVTYLIRNARFKKRLKVFQENCDQAGLSLTPGFNLPAVSQPKGSASLLLNYRF